MDEARRRLSLQGRYGHHNNQKNERRRRNREASMAIKARKQSVPAFAIRRQNHPN